MPKRFTIYDAMEARGDFAKNPANTCSVDPVSGVSNYKRQEFPKMLYHPDGAERVTRPGEALATPLGVKIVGEQRELVHRIVADEKELNQALKEGWHLSPAKAMKRGAELRGEEFLVAENSFQAAEMAKQDEVAELRRKIAELEEQNAALELGMQPKKAGAK